MNKSIWNKEIDTALYNLIGGITLTDGSPIKVVFKYPDLDYDSDTLSYPMVQITALTDRFDDSRYDVNNTDIIVSRTDTLVITEKLAKPYKILYYIEPIAEFLEDINELTLRLNYLFGRFYNLEVVTANGENAIVPMSRGASAPLLELDTRKKRRLFKRTLAYNITAFADFGVTYEKYMDLSNVITEVDNELY